MKKRTVKSAVQMHLKLAWRLVSSSLLEFCIMKTEVMPAGGLTRLDITPYPANPCPQWDRKALASMP